MRVLSRWGVRLAGLFLAALVIFLGVRAWESQRGLPLEPWHTHVPDDVTAAEIEGLDWNGYLAAEEGVFAEVRAEVTQKLDPEERVPVNRYFEGSPIYPGRFAVDWNRTQVLEPDGPPTGAVVFLHGLTDAPYSGRHITRAYRDRGFVALIPRLPAHGTVPAALTDVEWEDWTAATRLAVQEARRRAGPGTPLHVVGFSNGGALAMQYALDAIEDDRLARPDRLVLISPMIGITAFARFAGIAGWPALFPAFAKAAWLSVVPEFIPFKYNSFPINGASPSLTSLSARGRSSPPSTPDCRPMAASSCCSTSTAPSSSAHCSAPAPISCSTACCRRRRALSAPRSWPMPTAEPMQ